MEIQLLQTLQGNKAPRASKARSCVRSSQSQQPGQAHTWPLLRSSSRAKNLGEGTIDLIDLLQSCPSWSLELLNTKDLGSYLIYNWVPFCMPLALWLHVSHRVWRIWKTSAISRRASVLHCSFELYTTPPHFYPAWGCNTAPQLEPTCSATQLSIQATMREAEFPNLYSMGHIAINLFSLLRD